MTEFTRPVSWQIATRCRVTARVKDRSRWPSRESSSLQPRSSGTSARLRVPCRAPSERVLGRVGRRARRTRVGCVNSACLQICEFASPGPEFRHPTGDGGSSSPSDASPNSGLRHESSCGGQYSVRVPKRTGFAARTRILASHTLESPKRVLHALTGFSPVRVIGTMPRLGHGASRPEHGSAVAASCPLRARRGLFSGERTSRPASRGVREWKTR
jgi:hypothetical protein